MKWGILIGIITLLASILITVILNLMGLPVFFFAFFLPLIGMPLVIKKGELGDSVRYDLAEEIKFCPNCGLELMGWENYCPKCGFKIR